MFRNIKIVPLCLFAFCISMIGVVSVVALGIDEQKPEQAFSDYRQNLITYQPEFTVEGSKMVTFSQAQNKSALSKESEYNICLQEDRTENSETYCVISLKKKKDLYFESGNFIWYVWYEEGIGYSRFSPVKTKIAKFPKNPSNSQSSYAIFSYQGLWFPHIINENFYSLRQFYRGMEHGQPDTNDKFIVFHPDSDYPLFFLDINRSRYGAGRSCYYNSTILTCIEYKIPGGYQKIMGRSLRDGSFMNIDNLSIEEIQGFSHF